MFLFHDVLFFLIFQFCVSDQKVKCCCIFWPQLCTVDTLLKMFHKVLFSFQKVPFFRFSNLSFLVIIQFISKKKDIQNQLSLPISLFCNLLKTLNNNCQSFAKKVRISIQLDTAKLNCMCTEICIDLFHAVLD